MSDAAVELAPAQPTGLMAWLRFDASRVSEVEAAYDTYIRACRPGVYAAIGVVGGLVAAIIVGVATFGYGNAFMVRALTATYVVVFYGALAVPVLRCPRDARMTLLKGCTDVGRTTLFTVAVAFLISVAELTMIGLLRLSHIPVPKNPTDMFMGGVVVGFIVAVVVAPIAEEFMVQGWLQTRLRGLGGSWSAVIATAFFLAIHVPTNLYDLVRGGNLAFAAYLRSTTRSLGACILAHACNNAFFFAILLAVRLLPQHVAHH